MSKYSVEEVLKMAKAREYHGDYIAEVLIAYAERIEADEKTVPVYQVREASALLWRDVSTARYDNLCGADGIEWRVLFTHPPAQAAQVDHTMGDLAHRDAEPVAQGAANRVFIEETNTNGKPTGYLNEMYGALERSLRGQVEQDGMHGSYPDKLCIKAADAIANLRIALASQIDITNTERGHAERAAKLLAAQPRAAPDGWVKLLRDVRAEYIGRDRPAGDGCDSETWDRIEAVLAAAPPPGGV